MRVRFFSPVDDQETARHLDMMRRIDGFWERAAAVTRPLAAGKSPSRSVCEAVQQELDGELSRRVVAGLVVEVDAAEAGSRVVIAPASDSGLDPLVDEIVKRAPRLPGVSVARYRPAAPLGAVVAEVRAACGLDLSDARARAGFVRGHLLEVVVYSPSFSSAHDEQALDAANLAIPRLVGEEVFDQWIGGIEVSPMKRRGALPVVGRGADEPPGFDLAEIVDAVEVAVRGVDSELSDAPYHTFCERAAWSMLNLEPQASPDYPRLDDLVLCSTMLPEMAACALGGARFSSRRFSKHGERFVFLKVDGEGKSENALFDERLMLEDALNRSLVPGRVGCVVGAGLGLRYLYLILALADVDAGLTIARRTGQKQGIPRRSWFQFFDSSWSHEWVGAYDDSPVPPGM